MRLATLLFLTLSLLAASCGGSASPAELIDEGDLAMNSDDDAAAVKHYQKALEALGGDASAPEYFEAKFKSAQAMAKSMPERAKTALLELAKELPDKVTAKEYRQVAERVVMASDGLPHAVALVQAGLERFPDTNYLTELVEKLGKLAEKDGAEGALESLKGLGYVGD